MQQTFKVKFVFDGEVTVDCDTKKNGLEIAKANFHAVIGSIDANHEDIADWNIDLHPTKTVIS
jgi:xylose isomerase